MAKGDDRQDPEQHIRDTDDYIQHRRIKEILDARAKVREVENRVSEWQTLNRSYDQRQANKMVRQAIEAYIREIRVPLKERGKDYWTEKTVVELEVEEPEKINLAWEHKRRQMPQYWNVPGKMDTEELPPGYEVLEVNAEQEKFVLNGLRSLLIYNMPFTADYEIVFWVKNQGEVTHNGEIEKNLSRPSLMRYFNLANEFIAEIGLAPEPDDGGSEVIRNFDQSPESSEPTLEKVETNGHPNL